MSRGKRNSRKPRAARNGGSGALNQITKVPFHSLTTFTLSGVTGTSVSVVTPDSASYFAGLAEIGDQFDLFRCASLKYRIHPMNPADTVNQVVSFYPDVDTQTQTVAQAAESPIAAVQTPFCGVPSRWVKVPSAMLKGMLDWYKCTADAGATEFERQGVLYSVGGLSDQMIVEIAGVMHFKNPVSSALMMQRAIDRAVAKGLVARLPAPDSVRGKPLGGRFGRNPETPGGS